MKTLNVNSDVERFVSAIKSLSQAPESPLEFSDGVLDFIKAGSKSLRLDVNSFGTAGAHDIRITFQPSDRLLDLIAATWARNGKGLIIENF